MSNDLHSPVHPAFPAPNVPPGLPIAAVDILFKDGSPDVDMHSALEDCNAVLLEDFGPGHVLRPRVDAPDMLAVAREPGSGLAVGLLTLHLFPSKRGDAWEIGTMSAARGFKHKPLFDLFLERVQAAIVERHRLSATGEGRPGAAAAWLVCRVKQDNARRIRLMEGRGFEAPAHFMEGVLSDEGYVPFDPFFEVLMKRRVPMAREGI